MGSYTVWKTRRGSSIQSGYKLAAPSLGSYWDHWDHYTVWENRVNFLRTHVDKFIMNANIVNKFNSYVDTLPNNLKKVEYESNISGYLRALKDFVYISNEEWKEMFVEGTSRYIKRVEPHASE